MGNRVGSPPSGSGGGGEGQDENNGDNEEDEDNETVQTGLGTAAGAGGGVMPPMDGDVPNADGDDSDGDDPEEDEDEDAADVPDEEPVGPPSEPDVPSGGDDSDYSEPVEDRDDCGEPEDVDDLDDDEEPRFVYGDIVHDRDLTSQDDVTPEDVDRMVVVNVPGVNAYAWECGDDETVADRNPHYPPTDDVIVIVNRETLDERVPSWDELEADIPVDGLVDAAIPYVVYPSFRLELDEPSHLRDPFTGA